MSELERVRALCLALPETSERLSHGAPTFFVGKRVFVSFADQYHGDERVAVWLPVPAGMQAVLIETEPVTFFRPPYVGHRGWVGIDLAQIGDEDLGFYVRTAWEQVAPKRLLGQGEPRTGATGR